MKKLLRHSGETLIETLFSVAMIAVIFLFLTGAVTAAARVNNAIKNSDSEFRIPSSGNGTPTPTPAAAQAVITDSDGNVLLRDDIKVYPSETNEYYYYQIDSSGSGG